MRGEKTVSEATARSSMARLCAQREYCAGDVREKLRRMGLTSEAEERVVRQLTAAGFVDERRYTHCFIRDKLTLNGWGRRKIELYLRQKNIPEEVIREAFADLPEADFTDALRPLLEKKRKRVTGASAYEKNGKLIRYALARGFSMDEIRECLNNMAIDEFPEEA